MNIKILALPLLLMIPAYQFPCFGMTQPQHIDNLSETLIKIIINKIPDHFFTQGDYHPVKTFLKCQGESEDFSKLIDEKVAQTIELYDVLCIRLLKLYPLLVQTIHIAQLKGHTAPVTALCFLPYYNQLVSAGQDKTIRMWNVQTEECTKVILGPDSTIFSLHPLTDRQLGSASYDGVVRVWNCDEGRCKRTLTGYIKPHALHSTKNPPAKEKSFIKTEPLEYKDNKNLPPYQAGRFNSQVVVSQEIRAAVLENSNTIIVAAIPHFDRLVLLSKIYYLLINEAKAASNMHLSLTEHDQSVLKDLPANFIDSYIKKCRQPGTIASLDVRLSDELFAPLKKFPIINFLATTRDA